MTRSRHARRASERVDNGKFNPEIRSIIAVPLSLGIYTEVLMTLPLPAVACKGCQKEFFPRKKMYSTYCSRDCAFRFKAAAPYSRILIATCKGCRAQFTSRRVLLYCSNACRPSKKWRSQLPVSKACRTCETVYEPMQTGGAPSEYCSSDCRDVAIAAQQRIGKAKRQARLVAATIEDVDPYVVFARDKWRCCLCGIKTPRAKRGTYDGDAPELDHIIPLAKKGEHSYRNTQCACRGCNIKKSDTPLGQLLLIG